MILPPSSTLSLCIVGDDLHAAKVSVGPLGARVTGSVVVPGFLSRSEGDARQALRPVLGPRRMILTVPSGWCAVRPIGLQVSAWRSARDEMIRSIDRLLPMTADEAIVGLVGLVDEHSGRPAGGCLVAVRRRELTPWRDAIERALGRRIGAVLSPHMAMLGLGLQRFARADVLETTPMGDVVRHALAAGLPTALEEVDEAAPDRSDGEGVVRRMLPSERAEASDVSGVELAVGAAVAPLTAPGAYAPLDGAVPTRRAQWIAPSLALAAALALLIVSPAIYTSRLNAGAEAMRSRQVELVDRFNEARELRSATRRLRTLLTDGVGGAAAGWRSVLPPMAEAHEALPEDGFLYRITVDSDSVTISGEASDAPGVLQRLEESPLLASARRTGPLVPSSEPGLEIFEMRAERADREDR